MCDSWHRGFVAHARPRPSEHASWISVLSACLLRVLVLHHFPALHHELYMLKGSDILQRVAINRNDVRPLARFKGSDSVRPAEEVSVVDGCSLNGSQWAHAEAHINCNFVRV